MPLKEEVEKGQGSQYEASDGVAPLPSDPVNHIRDPGAEENSGKGKGTHNNSDIRLSAAMGPDKEGKQEKGAET